MAPSSSSTKPKFQVTGYTEANSPKPASPSASVILVSPSNEILLLHRVKTSSAFPSAHVFPGGNVDPSDGPLPADPKDLKRHIDSIAYRTCAIRELFEETGILLARESDKAQRLVHVPRAQRKSGRHAVHSGQTSLATWLKGICADAVLDTDRLLPFSHWITPPNIPKRFSTQMYIYFVGLEEAGNPSVRATSDEVETMAPEWRRANDWLSRTRSGEVIMFPPQFILLTLISRILDEGVVPGQEESRDAISQKRAQLHRFVCEQGIPGPWRDKFISPMGQQLKRDDGRQVLALDRPGPELAGGPLQGDMEHVILIAFRKEGPRGVEVAYRKDVLGEGNEYQAQKEASKL